MEGRTMKIIKYVLILMTLVVLFGFSSIIPQSSNNYEELYIKGYNAYKKKNHVDALKYLYAYKVVAEKRLAAEDSAKINDAISDCELKLRRYRKQSERHQEATQILKIKARELEKIHKGINAQLKLLQQLERDQAAIPSLEIKFKELEKIGKGIDVQLKQLQQLEGKRK